MIVSAQVAIYPLQQDQLTPAITAVSRALEAAGQASDGRFSGPTKRAPSEPATHYPDNALPAIPKAR